jgi:hypothetical protein
MHHSASVIVALFSLAANGALAQEPAPESLGISEVSYVGTGCPQGTVGSYVSPDRLAMTLMFDNYAVELTSSESGSAHKNCSIALKLHAPAGWSVGMISTDFRGYGNLNSGVIGEQRSMYRFGQRWTEVGVMRMTGPTAVDYTNSTDVDPNTIEWSPCIRHDRIARVTINIQVMLSKYVSQQIDYQKLIRETREMGLAIRAVRMAADRQLPNTHPLRDIMRQLQELTQSLQQKAASKAPSPALNEILSSINHTMTQLRGLTQMKRQRRGVHALFFIKRFELSLSTVAVLINPATADAKGLLTMDTADAEVKHEYGLMWKKCDPNQTPRVR